MKTKNQPTVQKRVNSNGTRLLILFGLSACLFFGFQIQALSAQQVNIEKSLPKSGELKNGKPNGKGWTNLLKSSKAWIYEPNFWQFGANGLHGELGKEKEHHYGYTKKTYKDFELNVMIKMVGDENANSGVCARIQPTNFDNAPGYQIDMGKGYWGCLWDERRDEMVVKYPEDLAAKIVNQNDWNHYYIIVKGHHVEAWLNGVKTIDTIHENGLLEGNVGFQLCHMHSATKVDIKTFYLREIK